MATPACDCIKYGSPLAESDLMKYAISGVCVAEWITKVEPSDVSLNANDICCIPNNLH